MLEHFNLLLCINISLSLARGVHHLLVIVLMNCERRIDTPVHSLRRVSEEASASTGQNNCETATISTQLLIAIQMLRRDSAYLLG